jgi:hypothetical protein
MIRTFKMLGLALVAMLALGAMASVASAAKFHSEASSTTLTGEQPAEFNDKFKTDAGNVECKTATYTGTVSGETTSTASATPSYSGCTAAFGASVTIDVNGCSYEFHTNNNTADVVCPEGKVIEVTAPGCVVTVGAQTGLNGVSFSSNEAKSNVTVTVKSTNVKYEEHNKGFFPTCANNTKATSNGEYNGSATVTGTSGGKSVNIWYA